MIRETYLRYGDERIPVRLPRSIDIFESSDSLPLADPDATILECLARPIGTEALKDLLTARKPVSVAITISDITRAVPNRVFLPHLLSVIESSGVERRNITIIVGTGMHRQSTVEEHIRLLGGDIYKRYRVMDHNAFDENTLTRISDDPPVGINSEFLKADFRIVTGFIEPHFMAGFSGGRKGVCPALVDLATIQKFHGFETLSSPLAAEGILTGNPCHENALKVARTVGVDFLFNVALNRDFEISSVFCGELEAAHLAGCEFIINHVTSRVDGAYDLVVTNGGGYPLDCNFYQSVKGMCMALPALKSGGVMLQVSECREGIGSDAFREILFSYKNDWRRFLGDLEDHKENTRLDQWEVQMLCRVLAVTGVENLRFFSRGIPEGEQEHLFISPLKSSDTVARSVETFVSRFMNEHPGSRIALVPDGPYTILQTGNTGETMISL